MKIEKEYLDLLHEKFKPFVDKLVAYLKKKRIETIFGEENISFTRDGIVFVISYWCFYRQSGLACVYKEKGESSIEIIEVTDSMFIENYMKPCVELAFGEFK